MLEVRRVRFGTIVRPAEETADGWAHVEALDGFLVPLPDGLLLFDTGIAAGDPEVDAHYRPERVPLREALAAAGSRLEDVTLVANCHLHLDHAGGNAELPGRPVLVQRAELEAARTGDYTVAGVVDFPGARYEVLDRRAPVAAARRRPAARWADAPHRLRLDGRRGGGAAPRRPDRAAAGVVPRAARAGHRGPLRARRSGLAGLTGGRGPRGVTAWTGERGRRMA
jgi:glyoxylase-like metal-dependent hydrolase (beta-lactamase superfamily II)